MTSLVMLRPPFAEANRNHRITDFEIEDEMRFVNCQKFFAIACGCAVVAVAVQCQAHFLWVKSVTVDGKPQGLLFFGESPADETYHFPEKLAKAKLWSRSADGKQTEVATTAIDTDERVGLIGSLGDDKSPVLQTSQQYGVYGTALLKYHAKHIRGTTPDDVNAAGTSKELKLEIVPKIKDGDVELTVLWNGKPLADAAVTIVESRQGSDRTEDGQRGHLTFKPEAGGIVGVLANTMEKDKSGELDGKPYKGMMHYASLTFNLPTKDDAAKKEAQIAASEGSARIGLRARQCCRRCRSRWRALAPWSPMAGSTFTAVTRATSTSIRPRICRSISAAFNSMAAPSGKSCRCRRRCKVCRSWPTAARSIASAV